LLVSLAASVGEQPAVLQTAFAAGFMMTVEVMEPQAIDAAASMTLRPAAPDCASQAIPGAAAAVRLPGAA
jgi:hypothetical protein